MMWSGRLFIFCASVVICTAESVIESNQLLSTKLYQALDTKEQNVLYSPLGIYSLLEILYQWSGEYTKDALQTFLKLPDKKTTDEEYRAILPSLMDAPNITLKIVNKIYLTTARHTAKEAKAPPIGTFSINLEYINFGEAKSAASKINKWFRNNTAGRIDNIVTAKDFRKDTHSLLLNAIYLRGLWLDSFSRRKTKVLPFYIDSSQPAIESYMMERLGYYYYGELHRNGIYEAQIVKLRFKDRRYNMLIILPTPWRTIEKIEEIIDDLDLQKIKVLLKMKTVWVSLPRFKIQTKYDLVTPLDKIGLGMIFGDGASYLNFMDTYDSLSITKIFQKATIVIDEKGEESFSASDIPLVHRARSGTDPILFLANHPFLFIITAGVGPENQEKYQDEVIVFMGKVTAPRAVENNYIENG